MSNMNQADREILQFNNSLELIAKLIKAEARTIDEAVKIIRDSKLKT